MVIVRFITLGPRLLWYRKRIAASVLMGFEFFEDIQHVEQSKARFGLVIQVAKGVFHLS